MLQPDHAWQLVYDARLAAPSGILFPIVATVVFLVNLARFKLRVPRDADAVALQRARLRAAVLTGAFLVLTVMLILLPHRRLQQALASSRYEVVEGTVESFIPQDFFWKRAERWVVQGHSYAFAPSSSHLGFDQARVISAGSYVRIADVGGAIARIEVAR